MGWYEAIKDGMITPDNLEPIPKNPIIATFFRNIGRADRLGSGVRNLFKYSRFYSGRNPQLSEGDVFRIVVPLDESYSYDYDLGRMEGTNGTIGTKSGTNGTISDSSSTLRNFSDEEITIINLIRADASLIQKQMQEKTGYSLRTVKRVMAKLQKDGIIIRIGNNRSGKWQVN